MTAERPSVPLRGRALGVEFEFFDDVALVGLAPPAHNGEREVTTVWHEPDAIDRMWTGARPVRTREMRDAGSVLLTVDHDAERGYLVSAPGVGRALVSPDGLEVRGAPDPDGADWGILLTGQLLPLVATLRGCEVFHASGVVLDGCSWLICGEPGMGKTSLAAQLVMLGGGLLSDDVVALDDRLCAHPGLAQLHLRAPELERLNYGSARGLTVVGPTRDRHTFVADLPADAAPLGGIYILERRATGPLIEPLPQPDPFRLLGTTFNLSVQTPERLRRHLDLCARLAEHVPIYQARIIAGSSAEELAAAIKAHVTTSSPAQS